MSATDVTAAVTVNTVTAAGSTYEATVTLAGPQGPAGTGGTAIPQALGTASAGTAVAMSREDHVHAFPRIPYDG